MQTSVINGKNLERTFRIDAEFYQTKYLEIERILSGLKNLKPVTEVARVSDPSNDESVRRQPTSPPIANVSLMDSVASDLPIVTTVMVPPCFSFNCTASSTGFLSKSLIFLGTPIVTGARVEGSILSVATSSACFIQTIIFTNQLTSRVPY